ncbi:hypothetical protein AAE02nite_43730 [Adhaeribacter aerolatus]|uniref:Retropepsin-like aspartic endopeptidase domain-containing protein n=1 Tax=Adhaeribacter aerolatus TaxID=670289 RepID=A0A512B418_9BACT|nr:RimK/LysX family protein [Adhaeribacter aerolatus]GEO06709.1 hypothetical protein AAE02nite_43730 [Adhaeribacter aerolatus]
MGEEETKKIIGRREMVNFPLLELFEVEAKIDTGAYTSAIHCSDIREATLGDGSRVIRFQLLDPSHPQYDNKLFQFKEFTLRDIKSSFGDVQERYVIRTQIQLYEEILEADFSLSDRRDLKYPVLIGRALLQNNFLVDVSKKNVALKRKKRANRKKKKNNL